MATASDTTWVGKKPIRRIGGISDALSIASDLGFSIAPPPSQEEVQNLSTSDGEKGDDLRIIKPRQGDEGKDNKRRARTRWRRRRVSMALHCTVSAPPAIPPIASPVFYPSPSPYLSHPSRVPRRFLIAACPDTTTHRHYEVDKSLVKVSEAFAEEELWAAACLRVRSFNLFKPSTFSPQDHRKYLAEREFEALKERIAGKREGFGRVSCINATLPLSQVQCVSDDLCTSCKCHLNSALIPEDFLSKFFDGEEERVVVGSLDLNQCMRLPDEISGTKPKGIGADFARAYLSNVCIAKELHRHGLGYAIVSQAKVVAQQWGMTDLYVHVAVDNTPAKNLYTKSGFVYESDEPAWQARFLDRPRRILLWIGLPFTYEV